MNHFEKISVPFALMVLLGLQFHCERARANESFQSLMKAKNATELDKSVELLRIEDELQNLKLRCEAQIALRIAPISCFSLIEREFALGRLTNAKKGRAIVWLDELCSASKMANSGLTAAELEKTSERCRQSLKVSADDLEYKKASRDPVSVFRQRF